MKNIKILTFCFFLFFVSVKATYGFGFEVTIEELETATVICSFKDTHETLGSGTDLGGRSFTVSKIIRDGKPLYTASLVYNETDFSGKSLNLTLINELDVVLNNARVNILSTEEGSLTKNEVIDMIKSDRCPKNINIYGDYDLDEVYLVFSDDKIETDGTNIEDDSENVQKEVDEVIQKAEEAEKNQELYGDNVVEWIETVLNEKLFVKRKIVKIVAPEITNCESLLGSPTDKTAPAYYLYVVFNVIKYVAIILLIVITIMDFVEAVTSQDNDSLKKAMNKLIVRAILCVVIFLLPTLIEFVLQFLHDKATDLCIN